MSKAANVAAAIAAAVVAAVRSQKIIEAKRAQAKSEQMNIKGRKETKRRRR